MATLFYFAHPYTTNPALNFTRCCSRTIILLNLGYEIFSPVCHSHYLQGTKNTSYAYWMERCNVILQVCDGIIMAPDWQDSKGCTDEYHVVLHDHNKVMLFYDDIVKE